MKNDRFFIFLIIGIAIIVILSFVFVLSNQKQATYIADGTPEGVVNNYLLAWVKNDAATIEKYLADLENKPTQNDISNAVQNNKYSLDNIGVSIKETTINDDYANVSILVFNSNTPYDTYRNETADFITLIKQNGKWKISEASYPFWDWDWYQDSDNYKN